MQPTQREIKAKVKALGGWFDNPGSKIRFPSPHLMQQFMHWLQSYAK